MSLSLVVRAWLLDPVQGLVTSLRTELSMNFVQITQALESMKAQSEANRLQAEKAHAEVVARFEALAAAVAAAGNSPPEVDAALQALGASITATGTATQALDDLNPDAPAEPPAP